MKFTETTSECCNSILSPEQEEIGICPHCGEHCSIIVEEWEE